MNKKIRTAVLTSLIYLGLLTGLQAQEKYDFAIITYAPSEFKDKLSVSYNSKSQEIIEISKSTKDLKDTSPALEQISKMQDAGWELFDTNTITHPNLGASYLFYMRKKKN